MKVKALYLNANIINTNNMCDIFEGRVLRRIVTVLQQVDKFVGPVLRILQLLGFIL